MNAKEHMIWFAVLAIVVACAVTSGCASLTGNGDGPRGRLPLPSMPVIRAYRSPD